MNTILVSLDLTLSCRWCASLNNERGPLDVVFSAQHSGYQHSMCSGGGIGVGTEVMVG